MPRRRGTNSRMALAEVVGNRAPLETVSAVSWRGRGLYSRRHGPFVWTVGGLERLPPPRHYRRCGGLIETAGGEEGDGGWAVNVVDLLHLNTW